MADWKQHVDAASVDINAALTTPAWTTDSLDHLRDARKNLERAIEALEEAIEELP